MPATKIKNIYQNQVGTNRPLSQDFGPGAVMVGQGIYETSTTKKARLGERLQVGDRVFRYAYAGAAAILGGLLVQGPILGGSDTTLQTTRPLSVAAAAGDTRIFMNALTTAQVANLYVDGLASIFDATLSSALLFRVKGNSYLDTSGTSSYIELYDGVPTALTTSSQVELITNPYNGVITLASATAITGMLLGVAPVYVAANRYFWLQTFGPVAVIPYAALDLDEYCMPSKDSAGETQKESVGTNTMSIGLPRAIGTAGESAIIFLQILA